MAGRIATDFQPSFKTARPKKQRGQKFRRARQEDAAHLAIIRQLPCLVSGRVPAGEAAHVRYASAIHGKSVTGIGIKPDDKWTVPLCPWLHTMGAEAQHRFEEEWWWEKHNIDPLLVASKLYAESVRMRDAKIPVERIVEELSKIVLAANRTSTAGAPAHG